MANIIKFITEEGDEGRFLLDSHKIIEPIESVSKDDSAFNVLTNQQ